MVVTLHAYILRCICQDMKLIAISFRDESPGVITWDGTWIYEKWEIDIDNSDTDCDDEMRILVVYICYTSIEI